MAIYKHNDNPNAIVRFMRKLYNPLGFTKGYNFTLFFIFGGALFAFCLARTPYMNINGVFLDSAGPGEAYWYRQNWYKIGISIHLLTCIPAGILAVWQFVPVIRHKFLLFHRINGYICLLLLVVTNLGALMIARRAFGGTLATQGAVGILAIATTGSAVMAYINIKRLQIEQHRAWMLRTWVYMGGIITTRLIQVITGPVISLIGSYYIAMPCQQIAQSGGDISKYMTCRANPEGWTVVHANWSGSTEGIEEVAATFQLGFGMCIWIAFFLHAVGVEIYLHLTKAEGERLRKVSYERQLERGMKHPGRAGLTSDRFGDEEKWRPSSVVEAQKAGEVSTRKELGVPVIESDSSSEVSKPASVLGWDRS